MDEQRWLRIDDLLHEALSRDARERSSFVRDAANGDSELEREVRSLLAAHEREAPFLDEPARGGASRLLELDTHADLGDPVGTRFGPWRVTRVLAAGGMGAVYLAVRDDDAYRQTVAIKLVRRGLLGSSAARRAELQRRFQVERQVLASLDSPYIARLIDGGTSPEGRPYFVMEYVEGVPIDEHCAAHDLPIRAQLELFARVCEAVQHAHQHLVIHRDLKPANILVTPEGTPKLLDFGLAKLLDGGALAATAPTASVSGEFMGTFAWAAPEQVAGRGAAPDTRSDVYALGLILYRLLTGHAPYDLGGPMSEALQRIAEQPPEPPSRYNPAIDDELETIVLEALAKEPSRRYQSAGDLHGDLGRYLRGEPVLAKGDSGLYLLRKTMRRYRAPLSIAAAFLVLVSVSAAIAWVQAARLAEQRATLAEALRVSTVEQARAMAMAGSTALAEELLWPEHFAALDRDGGEDDQLARWALWELYLNEPCLRTMETGFDRIDMLALSDDGRWIGAVGDGAVVVLNAADGTVHRRLDVAIARSMQVAFRPGTAVLAIGGGERHLSLWDASSGRCVGELALDGPVRRLAYAGDSRTMVSVEEHGALRIWDAGTGTLRASAPPPEGITNALALSHDGAVIAVAGYDGRLHLLDGASAAPVASFFDVGRSCNGVCFSRDGRWLAVDQEGTTVVVLDLRSHERVLSVDDATGWIRALQFDPAGGEPLRLAAAGFDKRVLVWEVPSGRLVRRYTAHSAPIYAMAWTADGAQLVSAGRDSGIKVWEMAELGCVQRWPEPGTVFDLCYTRDGAQVLTANGDGPSRIGIRRMSDGAVVGSLEGHHRAVTSLALSPDGTAVASTSYDGTVRRWPLVASGAAGAAWQHGRGRNLNSITWSPDGATIAVGGDDGLIEVHRAADGTVLERIDLACDRIPSLRYSPDGRFLAAAVMPRDAVTLIDRTTGEHRELPAHEQSLRILRFSPSGDLLASAGDDLVVRLWSMRPGEVGRPAGVLRGHQQDIFALAFSPDGRMIASSGRSGIIRLWHVASGRCLLTLPPRGDMIFNVAFSPDGQHLASGGRDRELVIWDLSYYDRHIAGNEAYWRAKMGER